MRNYNAALGSLCCWLGPIVFKKWTESGEELFNVSPECAGFGLRLTIRSPVLYLRTLSLEIFVQRQSEMHRLETASLRWSIASPKIIPKDSVVMKLARVGDLESIMAMFVAGSAGCTDTTASGMSLLHVCKPDHNDAGDDADK